MKYKVKKPKPPKIKQPPVFDTVKDSEMYIRLKRQGSKLTALEKRI